jgi:hypothetical protein
MDFMFAVTFAAGRWWGREWRLRVLQFTLSPTLLRFDGIDLTNAVLNRQKDKAACGKY